MGREAPGVGASLSFGAVMGKRELHRRVRATGSWLGVLAVLATVLIGVPVPPPGAAGATAAPAFAATASLKQEPRFLGDATGSSYTFTVTNTGASARIGAVEIDRPVGWKIKRCPRPAGWKSSLSSRGTCRFRSPTGSVGDVRPGRSITLRVVATTAPGRQDRTGTWSVVVSKTHELGGTSGLKDAAPGDPGLTATLHTFEVTDVVVTDAAAPSGSACPASADARAGQTTTVVVCGRNRANVSLRPVLTHSSLGGSLVHEPGAFATALIPPGEEVVLARWSDTEVAREPGVHHDVTATVGSSSDRTSPLTTLTDLVVTGHVPAPVDDAYEVAEDATLTVPSGNGLLANDQDADGDSLLVTGHGQPANGELAVADDGSFTYEPDADHHGADSFSYSVSDGTATSTATASIDVTPVNDAPSFVAGASQVVNEDAGSTTLEDWATAISPGPNESDQALSFEVETSKPALFSVLPTVSPAGALTFTPAADAHGVATLTVRVADDGGTGGGGVDRSPAQDVTIEVRPANDAPSFTKGADQTLNEDAGTQSVSNWATSISQGPADEMGQTVAFTVTNDNNALFSSQPAVSPAGVLTYTPAAHRYGAATVSVVIRDNGGTANGGDDTSNTQTFTITVNPVNDAPFLDQPPDQTVVEDSGFQTVDGFAGNLTHPGPQESGQTVSLVVEGNDNSGLFSVQPSVTAEGTLRYTPAADANGSATVTVRPTDDGGTANGGDDTGNARTFTITVAPVNDEPSFTKGADQTVNEDAGAQSVSNWATSISPGPANEMGQTLAFTVTNDNNALFSFQPVVAPDGTLQFTPAANKHGVATMTVTLTDNGGTANGGDNTSSTQTFTIMVNGVNDAPVARPKSYVVHTNMRISLGGLLVGATDPDDAAANPSPSFTVESITPGAGCPGCTVSILNPATGTFEFDPPPGGSGTYEVTYRIRDNGGPGPGEVSAPQTITFNVAGPVIWFVDPNAAPGGTGRLSAPFKTLADANLAVGRSSDHRIFVVGGDVAGNVTLRSGQWLLSDAVTGTGFDAVMGISPPAGTIARPTINRIQRLLAGTVTLGSNAVLRGLDIAPPNGSPGLVGNGASGVFIEQVSVATVGARAVDLTDTWGTMFLTRVSAAGADRGISLVRTNVPTGFLKITGGGGAGTGGVIAGSTAPGTAASPEGSVYLDGARNVTLRALEIGDGNANGIYAVNSPGLLVDEVAVSGQELHGIAVRADGAQVFDVVIDGGTYQANAGGGIDLHSNGAGGLDFLVSDGTIEGCGACGSAISVTKGPNATSLGANATYGTIVATTITNAEPSIAPAVRLRGEGNGGVRVVVTDNTVTTIGNRGVDAAFGGTGGLTNADLVVAGNVMDLGGAGDGEGIRVEAGVTFGTPISLCADLHSNTIVGAPAGGITLVDASAWSFRLPGYTGPSDDLSAVEQFLLGQNDVTQVHATIGSFGAGFTGGGSCALP